MIVPVAQCQSRLGWFPVKVESHSQKDVVYNVWTSPFNDVSEYICECEGYYFRGRCTHQDEAERRICRWTSLEGPEEQTKAQRRAKICPRCLGPAQWVMEEVEEEDAS